jgi:hypothetical protein
MKYTSNGLALHANTNLIDTNEQIKLSIRVECREKTVDVNTEQHAFFIPFARKITIH